MKKLFDQKKLKHNAAMLPGRAKLCFIAFVAFIVDIGAGYAQAPTISYSGPQTYSAGVAISPLAPTSSGVGALGYNTTPQIIGNGITLPSGVAIDAKGNIYVVENTDGFVEEFPSGGGKPVILSTDFKTPTAVAVDAAGNLYVTDSGNGAVKKIPAGGGAAVTLATGFDYPEGIAVDGSGNVYVADSGNSAIKMIPAGGGTVVTLGSGFAGPRGVAVDAAGDVYVGDTGNSAIKMIQVSGGAIVTLTTGILYPGQLAVDLTGKIYVVGLSGPGNVYRVPPGGGTPVSIYRSAPYGITVDRSGNVLVADEKTDDVVEIPGGNGTPVPVVKGSGLAAVSIAVNAAGDIYAGTSFYAVKKSPANGGPLVALAWNLGYPQALAVDAANNVYVCNVDQTKLTKSALTMIPADGGALVNVSSEYDPLDVAVDAAGNILVADDGIKVIQKPGSSKITPPHIANVYNLAVSNLDTIFYVNEVNAETEEFEKSGPNGDGGGGFIPNSVIPSSIRCDLQGNLYMIDNGFVKMVPVGQSNVVTLFPVNQAFGIAVGTTGILYVIQNGSVKKYLPNGGYYISPALPAGLHMDNTTGIISGTPSVTTPLTNYTVTAYNGFGSTITNISIKVGVPSPPTISYPSAATFYLQTSGQQLVPTGSGVYPAEVYNNPIVLPSKPNLSNFAVDSAGNYYLSQTVSNQIFKYDPQGNSVPLGINITGVSAMTAFTLDNAGNFYIADANKDQIVKFPANGGAPVVLLSGAGFVTGLALDAARNIYYSSAGEIEEIPAGGGAPTVVLSGFKNISCLVRDAAGSFYFNDQNLGLCKVLADGTKLPYGMSVSSIAMDPTGNLYVVDINNNILKIDDSGEGARTYLGTGIIDALKLGVDAAGDIYVTEASANDVKKLTPAGGYYISLPLPDGLTMNGETGVIAGTPLAASPAKNYTIVGYNFGGGTASTVNIQASSLPNLNLTSMQPSAGHLSPAFVQDIIGYADTVAYTNLAMTITPVAADPTVSIKVNGVAVASGSPSQAISLAQGTNRIKIVVATPNGFLTKTYVLSVFRPYSNDANLSFMQPTAGMMSPIFTPVITRYTDTVNYTNLAMEITPIAQDSLATIKVNGVAVVSGSMSQAISLNQGLNTITTVVTAPDGVTTKTFTITVFRAFSTDAYLTQIQPSAGMMSPVFNPMVTGYTDEVNNSNAAITLTPAVRDPLATITVNGAALASGATSPAIPLAVGSNTITIAVTAPDGVTTKTYTLTVTRDAFSLASSLSAAYQPIGFAKVPDVPNLADDNLLVHQGISPNGDGVNDFLQIDNISQYPDNKLSIMNRDGQLIFEARGYDNNSKVFDGHSNKNGRMQLPGTYFYQLEYTVKGITKTKTGFLVLKY